ncbi:MAG: hypothetical protein KIS76_10160 [Pyrinomonadaceae bacterium]|nr:hypothetical protein [Pyrinomonadaceae bacterium]
MTVGEHIQNAVDNSDRGNFPAAFVSAAHAVAETLRKTNGKDSVSEDDFRKFVKENWELISFMCIPLALPLPLNVPFGVKRIEPRFNVHHGADEIIVMLLEKCTRTGKLPPKFTFRIQNGFEIIDGELCIPFTVIGGLAGIAVVHPANSDETISDKYCISIADFKMFISELWGRIDLAVRVKKFYLEHD